MIYFLIVILIFLAFLDGLLRNIENDIANDNRYAIVFLGRIGVDILLVIAFIVLIFEFVDRGFIS